MSGGRGAVATAPAHAMTTAPAIALPNCTETIASTASTTGSTTKGLRTSASMPQLVGRVGREHADTTTPRPVHPKNRAGR